MASLANVPVINTINVLKITYSRSDWGFVADMENTRIRICFRD